MATVVAAETRRADRALAADLPRQQAWDRWIYVAMAVWFIAIVLVGFIPDSLSKAAAIRAGTRPPFPAVMHLHAVLMGAFLLLLFTQSLLAATGRLRQHRRQGIAVAAIVPLLVVVGFLLASVAYWEVRDGLSVATPEARAALATVAAWKENVLLNQLRIGALFPLFMAIAVAARRRDPGLHKRMMFLATAVALPPAFARMLWLPAFANGAMTTDLYVLLAVGPMFVVDLVRNRRVHAAYWLWIATSAPAAVAAYIAWDQPWWHATARQVFDAARSAGLA